jgi:glycosyltransferase involved in cell wall biosynthesis
MTQETRIAARMPVPLVSVVMANYNGARYIAEAIASVQRQSLRDLEIIVSDDASSDDSVSIVMDLMARDQRIKLVRGERNGGPAAARNQALALAKGAWIAIMDSDDLIHQDRLLRLTDAAIADGADIVADDLVAFDERPSRPTGGLLKGPWARTAFWVEIADYVALNRFYGPGPALGYLKPLFRMSSFGSGALSYDESLTVGEDFDLVLRLLYAGGKFRVYPPGLYYYRKHKASVSHRLNEDVLIAAQRADRRFCNAVADVDQRLIKALAKRARSIETAIAYERLLAALKIRNWRRAIAIALARPSAAALLRLPIQVRLGRLALWMGSNATAIAPVLTKDFKAKS